MHDGHATLIALNSHPAALLKRTWLMHRL